jgi:hypothetical protein
MAAPTNISFATATAITAFPYTLTQDVSDAGVNYTVYYKFTAPANTRVMGAWGFSPLLETFRAAIKVYLGPADSPTLLSLEAVSNKCLQFPVTPGQEYFIEFTKNGDTSPATIAIDVRQAPNGTPAGSDFIITDDRDGDYVQGYPAAILSHTINHTVVKFVDLASGEQADSAINGNLLIEDRENYALKLYDKDFVLLTTIPFVLGSGYTSVRNNRTTNNFWIGRDVLPATTIYKVSDVGVLSPLIATLTGNTSIRGLATSPDETILYYSNINGSIVKRWDLVNDVALADLNTAIAGYGINDILGMDDGSIIVGYSNVYAAPHTFCRQYAADGTVVRDFEVGTVYGMYARLAYANDHPTSFWAWYHSSNGDIASPCTFINFKVSDATRLSEIEHTAFRYGGYLAAETAAPTSRFGTSLSCPLLLVRVGATPPEPIVRDGGIYYIHPDKTTKHDSYYGDVEKKIPNPTVRLGFIGD